MEKNRQTNDTAPPSVEEDIDKRKVPTQTLGRVADLASTFYKPPKSLTPPSLLGDAGYASTRDRGF